MGASFTATTISMTRKPKAAKWRTVFNNAVLYHTSLSGNRLSIEGKAGATSAVKMM